ncbi:cytochrome P450 6B2-like [Battus philenor]|uniref:cytochrome P450 6B2-like n=1 Tax=Battus philenor TaxID=42288 RepID=UPI0035CEC31F
MLIYILIIVIIIFYIYSKNYMYWSIRNVKHDIPVPLFGNRLTKIIKMQTSTELYRNIYTKYPSEKFVGHYRGSSPELIIRDPEIVKHILNRDFLNFYVRHQCDPKYEPLMKNLFVINGNSWKLLRQSLTSVFTGSKLRNIFPFLLNCAERMQNVGSALANSGEVVDAYILIEKFIVEFIEVFAFGIELDTTNHVHSLFLKLGKKIFHRSKLQTFLKTIEEIFPGFGYFYISYKVNDVVRESIVQIRRNIRMQRELKSGIRNDFMDLLTEMEKLGKISGDAFINKSEDVAPKIAELEIDELCIAAQVYIFFAAGYETSTTATSYTLHLLAYHPEVQRKVQNEIDRVLLKYDKLCYGAISELIYLKQTVKESLRILPPGGYVSRVCTKEYTLPGTDVTIDPGVKIIIPIQAFHMDEKYYDNPDEFKPERFESDAVKQRHNYVYLPFGDGPRKCIAARLALMQSMAAITALLQKFSVKPAPTSIRNPRIKRTSYVVQSIEGGLPLILTPRNL